ncbi:dual specificity protein phosphatase 16-like protein, partial [Leptotrombidium deliense]
HSIITRQQCESILRDIYNSHPCAAIPNQVQEIIPYLYLSGLSGKESRNFDYVVDISNYGVGVRNIDFTKTLVICINDSMNANIYKYFNKATNYIHDKLQQNKSVIVHCAAGRSRSASIVIAYLIRYYNMSLQDAYVFVHNKRSCIDPNDNFLIQLARFENRCRKSH